MATLVEVFTEESIEAALATGSKLIGINSRNLRTLEMVPDNVARLSKKIPSDCTIVAESGVRSVDQVKAMKAMGISAMLVGESLLKQVDLESAARTLVEAGK
jgi:indole-3-glycerol phosphate synthase